MNEKMKTITIGDIHGRIKWKDIVSKENDADKIIFIGDYFDSHDKESSGDVQIKNFKEILDFKKDNPQKVILLTGNHDFHYIRGVGETYSGHQASYALEIGELVEGSIKDGLLQMCYLQDGYFFSHAGLTKTWCKEFLGNDNPQVNEVLVQTINDFLTYQPKVFKFNSGANSSWTGDDVTQGPIWVRPFSLSKDKVDDVVCVVGHTQTRFGVNIVEESSIILTDCLGETDEYLIIEGGKPRSSIQNV